MITVVGMGREVGDLTMNGAEAIRSADVVVVKSEKTHAYNAVKAIRSDAIVCDDLYVAADDFHRSASRRRKNYRRRFGRLGGDRRQARGRNYRLHSRRLFVGAPRFASTYARQVYRRQVRCFGRGTKTQIGNGRRRASDGGVRQIRQNDHSRRTSQIALRLSNFVLRRSVGYSFSSVVRLLRLPRHFAYFAGRKRLPVG